MALHKINPTKLKESHIYYVEWEYIGIQEPVRDLFKIIKIWSEDKIPYEYYCKPMASNYSLSWWTVPISALKGDIKLQEPSLEDFPLFIGLKYKTPEFTELIKNAIF